MIGMSKRRAMLADICRCINVDFLYVFGSRGKDVQDWLDDRKESLSPGLSDVDIGVKPASGSGFTVHDKVRLAVALEDFLGVGRVDLVSLRDADPFLAANIIRGERLYALDKTRADEYDLYILRRAGDLAPLERERMALILERKR
jgi:predicted nucleotidyltransferase